MAWKPETNQKLQKWFARSFLICLVLGVGLAMADHFWYGFFLMLLGPPIISAVFALIVLIGDAI
ncbi:hypothetical protein EON81_13645 [bacterium]|nr:MAG: hypothetical protein EON81_13645 [bacterium]